MGPVAEIPRVTGLNPHLIEQYQSRGYIFLEDAVDHVQLEAATLSLRELASSSARLERSDRYNKFGRLDFTKIPNLAKQSEPFRRLASSPRVVETVEALLGQRALIFRDVAIVKPAHDGAPFTYHQDSEYWDVEPRALVSAWVPLRDVGLEDGCLRVIEGSHRRRYHHDLLVGERCTLPHWLTALLRKMASLSGTGDSDASGFTAMRKLKQSLLGNLTRHFSFLTNLQELHARVPDEEQQREVSLPMYAGSVILFHSMLLHASNPNTSGRDRCAYIASYMGDEYTFCGVGHPEFLVARELKTKVFQKARVAHS
jgi:ectoine hydroxylase-related dioxygenase (phytanoyl-CoA dioxygenase family)